MGKRLVGVNELGRRVGEDHHNAKLTDAEVQLMWGLRAEGWGYARIAAKMEVSKSLIRYIVKGRVRCQVPVDFKRVQVT